MVAVEVPDGLAAMSPGPGLAAALGPLDLAQVPNDRILDVLRAQYRQLAHEQARTAATLAEVGRCSGRFGPGAVDRRPGPDPYGPEETRAALRWTGTAAYAEHALSESVVHAMPAVFAAWWAGDIDRPRVRIFHDYLDGLDLEVVARVCALAVPRAPGLTTGQLRALLRRMIISADPDAAARWYRRGLQNQDVSAYLAPDGTVTVTAAGLPVDEAEAACVRVQELAAAARAHGHPGRIGEIRCAVFLGLLDGRFHGMTVGEIIAALLANAGVSGGDGPDGVRQARSEPARVGDDQRGIEIRVALSTLIGRDERPAEIPGLGPVLAPVARERVARQRRAQWRFAVTDAEGHLVSEGVTRRRPASARRGRGPRGGIVELHVSEALLRELAAEPDAAGAWAGVVADIARQHELHAQHAERLDARPDDRSPAPALRRHTEIRDRTCTHPCCRRRAHACDQDHTRPFARGGRTVRANLGPTCPHDHAVKHEGGWVVEQPESGVFVWHSPLGGSYPSRGEFLDPPLPEPVDPGPEPRDEAEPHDGPSPPRPPEGTDHRRAPPPDDPDPPPS